MSEDSNGRFQKLTYGIGSIADTGSYSIISTFLLYFLIDVVFLDAGLASLIFMISYGVWNAINDPIVGVLSDKT
ncbi:MAG TPA: MFS transporter, partial [Candidatus Nanopelagicaceae bacterium]|nr:MFS transporter [Candidatus Nanopelagicaceae bacterium]